MTQGEKNIQRAERVKELLGVGEKARNKDNSMKDTLIIVTALGVITLAMNILTIILLLSR